MEEEGHSQGCVQTFEQAALLSIFMAVLHLFEGHAIRDRDRKKEKREAKSPALDGILAHNLLITRRELHHCATTTAVIYAEHKTGKK